MISGPLRQRAAECTLEGFFWCYYWPARGCYNRHRTLEEYSQTLTYWQRLTPDPPLMETTAATLAQFAAGLQELPGRRSAKLGANTIRKHLRQLQAILDHAGPPGGRRRDAAGVLDVVPWIRPPPQIHREPLRSSAADVAALYAMCPSARLPRLEALDVTAGQWWRGVITTICSTGLRIGSVWRLVPENVDIAAGVVIVPAEEEKKRRELRLPLHPQAVRDLAAIYRPRSLLFPQPHARTTIYRELYRLEELAGIPTARRFSFQQLRRTALTELAKVSPAAAQMAAGHASFQTTINHYIAGDVLTDAVSQSPFLSELAKV